MRAKGDIIVQKALSLHKICLYEGSKRNKKTKALFDKLMNREPEAEEIVKFDNQKN